MVSFIDLTVPRVDLQFANAMTNHSNAHSDDSFAKCDIAECSFSLSPTIFLAEDSWNTFARWELEKYISIISILYSPPALFLAPRMDYCHGAKKGEREEVVDLPLAFAEKRTLASREVCCH